MAKYLEIDEYVRKEEKWKREKLNSFFCKNGNKKKSGE